jgi:Ca-activated chloride channel family protein
LPPRSENQSKRRIKVSDTELTKGFAPTDAKTGKPIELAMQRLWLVGRIMGVGARLLVKHTFRSGEKKPLEVVYSFILPRDAALRRFHITGKGFSVTSQLKPVVEAVEDYEKALAEGHLASMARQYRDGMINLTVGNIRPGEEVAVNLEIIAGVEMRDDGIRFRFPFTLAPAYHAKARAAEVAPGVGEIELPADEFGDLILPQFVSDASALYEVGFDLAVSMGHPIVEAGSPSHAVRIVGQGIGRTRVSLATAKDVPDRDLVLDVRAGDAAVGALGGTGRDGRGHFAAVVPSTAFRAGVGESEKEEPRRVVFVLDRSGSMGGMPIEQARKAVAACLGALGEGDRFGIVAFDDTAEMFGAGMAGASMENREAAQKFLTGIDARGGTELANAIGAAAAILKMDMGGGGDILVVTDGQVMGTETILAVARTNGLRLHCLGIGSASQDRFLTLLARETGGVSRFVTPRERVDLGAVDLFASVGRPVGSALTARIEGFGDARIAPEISGFVFGGTPVVVYGDTPGAGDGRLVLEWEARGEKRTMAVPIKIGAGGEGETLRLLQGARLITDMESRWPGDQSRPGAEGRRESERVKKHLCALSQAYGLVSREMGLVAVVERAGDQPEDLPVVRVVPVGLAQDVMEGSYFAGQGPVLYTLAPSAPARMMAKRPVPLLFHRLHRSIFAEGAGREDLSAESKETGGSASASLLVSLASKIESDGGMPGANEEERVLATILALLQFLAEGHGAKQGAFRAHVKRMVEFLRKSGFRDKEAPAKVQAEVVKAMIRRAEAGRPLPGDWSEKKPEPALWAELEKALEPDK